MFESRHMRGLFVPKLAASPLKTKCFQSYVGEENGKSFRFQLFFSLLNFLNGSDLPYKMYEIHFTAVCGDVVEVHVTLSVIDKEHSSLKQRDFGEHFIKRLKGSAFTVKFCAKSFS